MLTASKHKANRSQSSSNMLEDVSWDKYTFKLPARLANSATVHPSLKDRYFHTTLEGLDAAQEATPLTKLNVLSSRFDFPHLIHEVDGSFKTMYDNTMGTGSNIIVTQNPTVFTVNHPSIWNEQGQPIGMPNVGQVYLNNAIRRTTRFYSFTLTVNSNNAYDGPAHIRTTANFEPFVLNAAVAMPSELINDATDAHNGYEVLPAVFTTDVLRNVNQTLLTITALNGGHAPVLGALVKPAGQYLVSILPLTFRKAFMHHFNLCRYKLFRELLRSEFLGKNLVDSTSVINELQSLKQNRFDPETRRFVTSTVEEFYGLFTTTQNLLPYNQLYPVDVAMLFWNGLNPDIRQQGEAADVPYTPPGRPQGQVETNQQADSRLRTVKDSAVRFEKQLDNVKLQVNRASRGAYNRSQANTFMTSIPNNSPGYFDLTENETASPFGNSNSNTYDITPFNPYDINSAVSNNMINMATPLYHAQSESNNDPLLTASVYLSVAEEAMQRATGSALPPIECWGCTDHPQYHSNRFHRWTDCPYRGDPSVAGNAKKGLQQFLDKRKANRRSNNDSNSSAPWRQRGYPNQTVAHLIASIADPRTIPSQRQAFIHLLTSQGENVNREPTPAAMPGNDIHAQSGTDTPTDATSYLALPVRVLSAIKAPPEIQLSISQVMPHINIPIGRSSRAATICCMVDSGAGLSLGRRSYHNSIYQRHPELVHKWLDLKDSPNMEEFTIGGIDSTGVPTKVTSMISYFTPFTVNGQAVHIQFALAEDVASNAIIGLPFLRSTHSSVLFEHDTLVSQKLGYTFKVFYQMPHQGEVAPISSAGSTATFPATIVTPPFVMTDIQKSGKALSTAFSTLTKPPQTDDKPYRIAPGLLLSTEDVNDTFRSVNDGDEWVLEKTDL
jgi:hypothetical protein